MKYCKQLDFGQVILIFMVFEAWLVPTRYKKHAYFFFSLMRFAVDHCCWQDEHSSINADSGAASSLFWVLQEEGMPAAFKSN